MPRRPNTKPTSIYWLVDTRPETLTDWPDGLPFYCGKTVGKIQRRLAGHKRDALRFPGREMGKRLIACANYVEIRCTEIVPIKGDWIERERCGIKFIRDNFPECLNIADGGEGPAGRIPSAKTRALLRAANLGKKATPETRAKLSAALKGRKLPEDVVARMKLRRSTEESREKTRLTLTGKKHSAERRQNISAGHRGKKYPPRSAEHCAKIAANKRAWWAARKRAQHD